MGNAAMNFNCSRRVASTPQRGPAQGRPAEKSHLTSNPRRPRFLCRSGANLRNALHAGDTLKRKQSLTDPGRRLRRASPAPQCEEHERVIVDGGGDGVAERGGVFAGVAPVGAGAFGVEFGELREEGNTCPVGVVDEFGGVVLDRRHPDGQPAGLRSDRRRTAPPDCVVDVRHGGHRQGRRHRRHRPQGAVGRCPGGRGAVERGCRGRLTRFSGGVGHRAVGSGGPGTDGAWFSGREYGGDD